MDEIWEEAGGYSPRRADKREAQELSEIHRRLGYQDRRRIAHVVHNEQALPEVPLLQANPCAAQHHPLHAIRVRRRHLVPHEPAVADPDQARPPYPERVHRRYDAVRLERFGPLRSSRERSAEEKEVRDVYVEAGEERTEEGIPLPSGFGAESMDKNDGGLPWVREAGDPALDGGFAAMDIDGGAPQPGGGERTAVPPVPGGGVAETPRHRRRQRGRPWLARERQTGGYRWRRSPGSSV